MPTVRGESTEFLIFNIAAYLIVFLVGVVGNSFVILALVRNPSMRTVTNFFIVSLAVADLLICIFVVPLTLTNNVIIEWLFGEFICKCQVWLSGTTVCASVYILVAVSADRYLAICHPLKYSVWNSRHAIAMIIGSVWIISGIVFIPWYMFYHIKVYSGSNHTIGNETLQTFPICEPRFPSRWLEIAIFFVLNVCIAFFIPLCAIVVLYVQIFLAIVNRKAIAVDNQSSVREHRLRVRVTHMMLAVIVTFVICWIPLYTLFTYMLYYKFRNKMFSPLAGKVIGILRPIFQWLSLANSCLNPILYASFSAKYRLAFLEIIVLPCRRRYGTFRRFAQSTIRRVSDKRRHSVARHTSSVLLRGDGSMKSVSSRWSIKSAKSIKSKKGSLRNSSSKTQVTVMTPFLRQPQPDLLVHQTPPDLSYFQTIINDKYIDDGSVLSIPLFEKISTV